MFEPAWELATHRVGLTCFGVRTCQEAMQMHQNRVDKPLRLDSSDGATCDEL
jgi:hypothetical protein